MPEQISELLLAVLDGARAGLPTLVGTCLLLIVTVLLALGVGRLCEGLVSRFWPQTSSGVRALVTRVVRWTIVLVGALLAVVNLGVNLEAAVASGTVLFVGLGLAVQKVVQSFVAGTLLLAERAIAPGDVLDVGGEVVLVEVVGARTTTVLTRRNEVLTIPNYELATNTLRNLSKSKGGYWIRVSIAHAYGDDSTRVESVLFRAALDFEGRVQDSNPRVLLVDLGDSGVEWRVEVAVSNPWRAAALESELRHSVLLAVLSAGFSVPFPQLDVHMAEPSATVSRTQD